MTNKWPILISGLLLAVLTMAVPAQDLPKLHEKVEVNYIEVPIRVFHQGKPVEGLTAGDFTLFLNGKEVPVTAVSKEKKRLDWGEGAAEVAEPRLFVLIFNITDFRMDLSESLDPLFDHVLRPNDRLLMISNNFFIPERVLLQPENEKKDFSSILDLERKWLKQRVIFLENRLLLELNDLRARLAEGDIEYFTQILLPRFVESYKRYAVEHLDQFLNIQAEQYLKLADYFRGISLDKWVISFIQRGTFPVIKKTGNLYKTLLMLQREFLSGDPEMVSMNLHDILQDLEFNILSGMKHEEGDVAKPFTSTGATFHTVLLKPLAPDRMLDDFEWQPVFTETENVMKAASQLTGGSVIYDNRIPVFFQEIKEKEDILYRLVYQKGMDGGIEAPKIKVKVQNPEYDVLYNDQQQQEYLRGIAEKVSTEKNRIRFGEVLFKDRMMTIPVLEALNPENGGEIKIDLRLRIISEAGQTLFDRHREFKLNRAGESLAIHLPELKKGEYDIVVEGTDLNSGARDLVIHTIRI